MEAALKDVRGRAERKNITSQLSVYRKRVEVATNPSANKNAKLSRSKRISKDTDKRPVVRRKTGTNIPNALKKIAENNAKLEKGCFSYY